MKKIFVLKKENPELAVSEVLSLLKSDEYELHDDLLISVDNSGIELHRRLAYTRRILKLLFICDVQSLQGAIDSFDWQSTYKGDFCVRAHYPLEEKLIADAVFKRLKIPSVNLSCPETKYEFFLRKKKIIAGLFLKETDSSFLKRKAHMRPALHPTSMHPGLARACINLTGLQKGLILDPFCGSGGILIEARMMGFSAVGYDIDEKQLERAKTNMAHYSLTCRLAKKDAALSLERADAIVTDLPYGKGSKAREIPYLYSSFLENSLKSTRKMVVVFPDFAPYRKIIAGSGWAIDREFKVYVHGSLSRIILRLSLHQASGFPFLA